MLKKGRLAIYKMKIVRLIKVKSKVNVNVTKSLKEIRLIFILYVQFKDFLEKIWKITSTHTILKSIE